MDILCTHACLSRQPAQAGTQVTPARARDAHEPRTEPGRHRQACALDCGTAMRAMRVRRLSRGGQNSFFGAIFWLCGGYCRRSRIIKKAAGSAGWSGPYRQARMRLPCSRPVQPVPMPAPCRRPQPLRAFCPGREGGNVLHRHRRGGHSRDRAVRERDRWPPGSKGAAAGVRAGCPSPDMPDRQATHAVTSEPYPAGAGAAARKCRDCPRYGPRHAS